MHESGCLELEKLCQLFSHYINAGIWPVIRQAVGKYEAHIGEECIYVLCETGKQSACAGTHTGGAT
jgi:hypothetical protein